MIRLVLVRGLGVSSTSTAQVCPPNRAPSSDGQAISASAMCAAPAFEGRAARMSRSDRH
jgi:hypothetical protein